jgi:Flp pilus assembly protein TadB
VRTTLLRKLALATTTTAIDSLHQQIRDANASIASDLATLRGIERQVATSDIELTITTVTPPARGHRISSGGGFTLDRAVHDAGRVLVVAAGVALIALAVLVPAGLVVALCLWLAHHVRRHRRERTLDLT